MDTCPVPDGYDACRVRPSIESALMDLGYCGPVTITAMGNLRKTPPHVLQALSSTGILVQHSISSRVSISIFDDLLDFKRDNPPPATIMLISDTVADALSPFLCRSLKPSPKWDVFGFGVILLELLTGKIVSAEEIALGNGLTVDDGHRAVRMADVAIRGELDGKEDFLISCFKLGYNCASPIPQKRPNIKESLAVLERFPLNTSLVKSTSFHY